MKYHLRVYGNYNYGDDSEAYDHGAYDTYEEAERAAKAIVNELLEPFFNNHRYHPGKQH